MVGWLATGGGAAALDPEGLHGLYIPHWTFDAKINARYQGQRGEYYYETQRIKTKNGVQTKQALFHQFKNPIDPYIIAGKPESGILPGIQNDNGPGAEGVGDHRIQAYCFRMCLTNIPENGIPFPKPENYDPMRYELSLRYINSGEFDVLNLSKMMPNGIDSLTSASIRKVLKAMGLSALYMNTIKLAK